MLGLFDKQKKLKKLISEAKNDNKVLQIVVVAESFKGTNGARALDGYLFYSIDDESIVLKNLSPTRGFRELTSPPVYHSSTMTKEEFKELGKRLIHNLTDKVYKDIMLIRDSDIKYQLHEINHADLF